ncbi:MAG TPA: helix-turn-helix transcriptional regulator [Thermoanaerobaculia bacterium]|nr:helix-turn-helix transcriptional regulator [Thermoanaerobaculia bacterium]
MFALVGETLRRFRKDKGLTLEKLGELAGLGRGQLSRIENGHQEATLSTLAKILRCLEVSRWEFFRRYERVEAEALAAAGQEAAAGPAAASWPEEVQAVLGRIESLAHLTLHQPRPVAQGAIEVGDLVVLFRIVPKSAVPETPPKGEEPGGPPAKRRSGKGRKA